MPTLATGTWTNRFRQYGFTLLEVMVTVVLIGIIASFAVLSMRGSNVEEHTIREAQRLTALIKLNRQEAILQGEQRGVRFTETGYTFLTQGQDGQWSPSADSSLQNAQQLPSGFKLKLWIEGEPVNLNAKPDNLPQVWLLSSGEITEFSVSLRFSEEDNQEYRLSGDPTGHLNLEPVP